jgi:hypothetical protein
MDLFTGCNCICFIIYARDTKRQATQHGCLPSLLGGADIGIEIVHGEEINICTGPTRAAKAEQKSPVTGTTSQTDQPRKDPFHLSSLSPNSPRFQQSAVVTPLESL